MRWVLGILAAAFVLSAGVGAAQTSPKRVALIVAEANYAGYPALPNTAVDAGLVRETLTRVGFASVEVQSDVGVAAFRAALARFESAATNADVALFYYAGHAVEVSGRNWLIPRDAALASDADLLAQAVDAVDVFAVMAGAKTRIVVLDACRENPFEAQLRAGGARGVGRGLGAPTAASGLADLTRAGDSAQGALLMYSAAPGRVAEDGVAGRGSPFARAFAEHFAETDVELRVAVGKISDAVAAETSNRQLPFSTLSLSGVPIVMLRNEDRPAPQMPTMPGAEFRDCDVCPPMVVLPSGAFVMGSPQSEIGREPEEVQRRVTIRTFAAAKTEVTVRQWAACVTAGVCVEPDEWSWQADDEPVRNVSWMDAQRFVTWLNSKVGGRAYRLLSEAEWEYAARAGTETAFWWGQAASHERENFGSNECCRGGSSGRDRWEKASPVGSFAANAYGLFDMNGNVSEWVQDCPDTYALAPLDGTASELFCSSRVRRGGSFRSPPFDTRSARRMIGAPTSRFDDVGLRVARSFQ